MRVRIARDEIRRIKDLTRTITHIACELDALVHQAAPPLLGERGLGVITAARLIGEIAGIQRFASDTKLARIGACAPIPSPAAGPIATASTPGANRQRNHAFYLLAINKIQHDPDTAVYIARQRARGTTRREAIRCLKRHLVRGVYRLLTALDTIPITVCSTHPSRHHEPVVVHPASGVGGRLREDVARRHGPRRNSLRTNHNIPRSRRLGPRAALDIGNSTGTTRRTTGRGAHACDGRVVKAKMTHAMSGGRGCEVKRPRPTGHLR